MEKARIIYLFTRRYSGAISPAEEAELRATVSDPSQQGLIEGCIMELLENPPGDQKLMEEQIEDVLDRIFTAPSVHLPQAADDAPAIPRLSPFRRWGWVAAAVVILALGTFFWMERPGGKEPSASRQSVVILPGKEGATLTLADGRQVLLDSIGNGVIALQGGVQAKIVNGELVYEGQGNEVVYNKMSTPKGRQFHLTLPDGSRVWLNAASSIRYPTAFVSGERRVEITGEAYFEVAKNTALPFRVNVGNKAEIEVLGTHFNVNSYENEASINTTLLEGSVRVSGAGERVVIEPGEEARVASGISIGRNVDLSKAVAWKNGLFNFDGAGLKEMMRQLERWYDIEVVYEGNVPNERFFGKMSRSLDLSTVLGALEGFGLKYRIEGRKLVITL